MQGFGGWLRNGGLMAVCLVAVVSCRKPTEASKSDLEEAGYALTTADWLRAAGRDDVSALKKFVAAGIEADACDESGDTALHAAAAASALKAADFLLKRGLDIDAAGAWQAHAADERGACQTNSGRGLVAAPGGGSARQGCGRIQCLDARRA